MHTIVDKIFKTSSPNGVTLESKTVHTPPLHSKLGSLLFSTITTEAQQIQEGVEEGKLHMYFPLFKLAKHQRGTLGQSVSANNMLVILAKCCLRTESLSTCLSSCAKKVDKSCT